MLLLMILSAAHALSVGQKFPPAALSKLGVKGKAAVLYFYGADASPSCTKQCDAFSSSLDEFKGVKVVGIRGDSGVKEGWADNYKQDFKVDVGDEIRNEIGIPKDLFGFLGGRETYVVDASGTVQMVFNNQFDPEKHVEEALKATKDLPKGGLFGF